MPQHSPLPPLARALLALPVLLALAGCGQTGRLFLRQPAVVFPYRMPGPDGLFHDLYLPHCLYDAEMAQVASLAPGALTTVAPEAITVLPATATVTDATGFQLDAPLPCELEPAALLVGAGLPDIPPVIGTSVAPIPATLLPPIAATLAPASPATGGQL